MLNFLLQKIIGTHNERFIKRITPLVNKVNALEKEMSKYTDDELKRKTSEYKNRFNKEISNLKLKIEDLKEKVKHSPLNERDTFLVELEKVERELFKKQGEIFDEIMPEAFALVREAAKRTIGLRHHDVQLIGGYVLHKANIAEMANGEGKTLVATLATYLNALAGEGVHVVTTNDYLAKRDRDWMGPVYEFLGLSVGAVQHDMEPKDKKEAYRCDITYATNNELGFDYLRDNMVINKEHMVQRGFYYAIIDEVDSILVDEARTPLIISGPAEESTEKYYQINKVMSKLTAGKFNEETKEETGDFIMDEKTKNCYLTEQGELKATEFLGLKSLHDINTMEYKHHINQALRAHHSFKRDTDYIVKDGKVLIVDDFTGRLMPGRRWSDGLHQAVEAKENLKIERENQTLATITFQNYFRMYKKLSGMSGTVATEANEFNHIYKLDVITIPTDRVCARDDLPDVIYKSEREKFNALCDEVAERYNQGTPVLVGTISIEKSEKLSVFLKKRNIPHQVLNAKYHETEAHIVAQAGRFKAVTIATNMAGRGTDIKLGGNVEYMAEDLLKRQKIEMQSKEYHLKKEELIKNLDKEVLEEREKVVVSGGLCVLGTERHESRRIDNQLRGRAGRQGASGISKFYLSLEDDLMRVFGSDRIAGIMDRLGMEEGQVIQHPLISRAIERAQKRVEGYNFDIRKQLLEYDNVMNQQREVIYEQRRMILEGDNLKDHIFDMLEDALDDKINIYLNERVLPEEWDYKELRSWLWSKYGVDILTLNYKEKTRSETKGVIFDSLKKVYNEKESKLGSQRLHMLEKIIMLQIVDSKWKDHLYAMDDLRGGIGLRAYGQKDPLIEYKNEGFSMFSNMINSIKEEITEFVFKVQTVEDKDKKAVFGVIPQRLEHSELGQFSQHSPRVDEGADGPVVSKRKNFHQTEKPVTYKREDAKVGRNDPCPCGSGKKYKKCCGR